LKLQVIAFSPSLIFLIMAEELLRLAWSQRLAPLAFGAEVNKLLSTNQISSKAFCGQDLFFF